MLKSADLKGSTRLQEAANGLPAPSVRKRPPDDEPGAVRAIQRALVKLGFKLPKSYPNGPDGQPDGLYGSETERTVRSFQQQAFPGAMKDWDGRCGPKTLAAMDDKLFGMQPSGPIEIPGGRISCAPRCKTMAPASEANRPSKPMPGMVVMWNN